MEENKELKNSSTKWASSKALIQLTIIFMITIVHIGQHKTGTTSLQAFLLNNKKKLKKQKIYYTDNVYGEKSPSQYILNVYALNKNRFSHFKEAIIKTSGIDYLTNLENNIQSEIERIYKEAIQKKCDKILWTNEGLYLLNSIEEYERLVNLFKPYSSKIIVVCCFREKKSYRNSYKKQLEKQNLKPSFDKDSYKYIKSDSWLFDYERKKEILKNVFDECLYFDYNQENNIKPFLKLLNIKLKKTSLLRLNVTRKNNYKKVVHRIINKTLRIRKKIKNLIYESLKKTFKLN